MIPETWNIDGTCHNCFQVKWGNEIYISKIAYVACCLNDVDRMQESVIHSNKAQRAKVPCHSRKTVT